MYVLCFTRPRYQVSVYRTIGPLVIVLFLKGKNVLVPIFYTHLYLEPKILNDHNTKVQKMFHAVLPLKSITAFSKCELL